MIWPLLFSLFRIANNNSAHFSDYFKVFMFCCAKYLQILKCRERNSKLLVYILAILNSVESKVVESKTCDLVRPLVEYTLYKKWSFPLRTSSVNVISCWRNPQWKTSLFLQWQWRAVFHSSDAISFNTIPYYSELA